MTIEKLNEKLIKRFKGQVSAREEKGCVVLTGALLTWKEVIEACYMAVDKKRYIGVLNDIVCIECKEVKVRSPNLNDELLDGEEVDVLIIGGGISGTSILRELSKYKLKLLLIDKEADVAMQSSGRNDGEVHPGVDLKPGSKKQHYVLLGNAMYDNICKQLDVPFRRCGQYALFTKTPTFPLVWAYSHQKCRQNCPTGVILRHQLTKMEPNLTSRAKFALYNPTAGVVSPYVLTIAYAENAIQNGARVVLNCQALGMELAEGKIKSVLTNRGRIYPKLVINCAGVFAEEIAKMANDRYFSIHPRKGTIAILDKKANFQIKGISSIRHLIEPKNTKGGGIIRTIDDNVLVGPTATETYLKEDFTTDQEAIDKIFKKQIQTSPQLKKSDIITYFSGIRAATFEEDFYIEKGRNTTNIIHVAGIQSPGLTTAPAVAIDVERMAIELLSETKKVSKNKDFNPIRHGIPRLKEMTDLDRKEMIRKNPDYGIIVCRCEEISKGEIIDALNSPLCVPTLDAIKRRVRPGMGRCQGGFCSPLVAQIIAEHQGISLDQVKKSGLDSNISYGRIGGKSNG